VKVYLPREDTADVTQSLPAGNADKLGGTETILVVEDDPDLRAYVAEILRSLDYHVLVASDGRSAMTIVASEGSEVDLLLTDIVMPGMDGRQLAREAQKLRPGLEVLYMTGYSRNAVVHQGRLEEGVDILQKPISQAELAHRVRLILDRAKSRRPT
jgi:DNA-binding response OmpR family regulator